jgi:hypothetical protein
MTPRVYEPQYNAHQKTPLCYKMLHAQLFKDCVSAKVDLDNYEGLINLWKYI